MNDETFDATVFLHLFATDPRLRVEIEWDATYGFSAQLHRQVPREEMAVYVQTGQWLNPQRRVNFVAHQRPDFDWWEPRYDTPWRRLDAQIRDIEAWVAARC